MRSNAGRLRLEIGEEGRRVHDAKHWAADAGAGMVAVGPIDAHVAETEQCRQCVVGHVPPVRKVLDRVGVLVQLLGDPEGKQQSSVDVVHRPDTCRAPAARASRCEPVDVVGTIRSASLDDDCTRHGRWTAASRRRRAAVIAVRARPSRSCNGLPSKSVSSIVVAGTQELTGMQVAVNAVTAHRRRITQRLQRSSRHVARSSHSRPSSRPCASCRSAIA